MSEPEIDDDQPEPQGCMDWVLNLFGIKIRPEDVEPTQAPLGACPGGSLASAPVELESSGAEAVKPPRQARWRDV